MPNGRHDIFSVFNCVIRLSWQEHKILSHHPIHNDSDRNRVNGFAMCEVSCQHRLKHGVFYNEEDLELDMTLEHAVEVFGLQNYTSSDRPDCGFTL